MSEKTSFHMQGERQVKAMIRNGRDNYEIIGREPNPRVAEAMAHAAKPLIDSAVESLKLDPNSEGMAIFELPDGTKALNKEPGVTDDDGYEISYRQIGEWVKQGHESADRVQREHYDKLAKAAELRKQADQIEREAAEV